jgi:hypothetical protein
MTHPANSTAAHLYETGVQKFAARSWPSRPPILPPADTLQEMRVPGCSSARSAGRITVLVLTVLLWASAGSAQHVFESVGERALGMGGAFVAVADDATAVHWNPAGLVTGPAAGMTIGWDWFQFGNQDEAPAAGFARRRGNLTSLGTWPLGLAYGRYETSRLVEGADGEAVAETLQTSQYSATILQSVTTGLIVGSTLKYVRGHVAQAPPAGATVRDALAAAADLEGRRRGAFDFDLGVMADIAPIRIGLTLKNLRSPSFGDVRAPENTLPRLARLGVAVLPSDGLTLAMDLDLNTVDLRDGLRRMFAAGGEGRVGRRLMVRAGGRLDLEGERQPVGAVGLSVALRVGVWLDAHYAQGQRDEQREYGAALRAGF